MALSADEYLKKAGSAEKKKNRLEAAKKAADAYIKDARSYRDSIKKLNKSLDWSGSTKKAFDEEFESTFFSAKQYVEQMDNVRDGYNREAAKASDDYWFFIYEYRKLAAEVENIFN